MTPSAPRSAAPTHSGEKRSAEKREGSRRSLQRVIKPKLQWDAPPNPAAEFPAEVSRETSPPAWRAFVVASRMSREPLHPSHPLSAAGGYREAREGLVEGARNAPSARVSRAAVQAHPSVRSVQVAVAPRCVHNLIQLALALDSSPLTINARSQPRRRRSSGSTALSLSSSLATGDTRSSTTTTTRSISSWRRRYSSGRRRSRRGPPRRRPSRCPRPSRQQLPRTGTGTGTQGRGKKESAAQTRSGRAWGISSGGG